MFTSDKTREERVLKVVVTTMIKYPNVFPQSENAKDYAEQVLKLKGDDVVLYHKMTLENRIGLCYVVRKKLEALNEIFWAFDTDQMDSLRAPVEKSVLMEYLRECPSREDIQNFKLIKNEELYW